MDVGCSKIIFLLKTFYVNIVNEKLGHFASRKTFQYKHKLAFNATNIAISREYMRLVFLNVIPHPEHVIMDGD